MNAGDRKLGFLIAVAGAAAVGAYLEARNSALFPGDRDAPADSAAVADTRLHGADWNGALPIASAGAQAPLPTTLPSSSSSPFGATNPPLSLIPAPLVPLPMDDEPISERQRGRGRIAPLQDAGVP